MRVNQRNNGGIRVLLGSYDLAPGAGHKVVLSDAANEYVIADAVRFVPDGGAAVIPRTVAADAVRFVANTAEAPAYVHPAHLGAPQKMTDAMGAIVWERVQRPFGGDGPAERHGRQPAAPPGAALRAGPGFHYNYFRDYDPTTGRY